jgi:hypothetical protein
VPRVLHVLRSHPASHSPANDAIQACTAAVAVLNNLTTRLKRFEDAGRLFAMLGCDQAACSALLHWCLRNAEAAEQLPPGQDAAACMGLDPNSIPAEVARRRHPFWTPFTLCVSFVRTMVAKSGVGTPCSTSGHSEVLRRMLQGAVTPELLERLLRLLVQNPCGMPLARAC